MHPGCPEMIQQSPAAGSQPGRPGGGREELFAAATLLLKLSEFIPVLPHADQPPEETLPARSTPCGQLAAAAKHTCKRQNLCFFFPKISPRAHSDTDATCRCPALHRPGPLSAQIRPGALNSPTNHPRAATGRAMQLF